MKSPMVTNLDYIVDKDQYSDLQVLESAAGFYIGTTRESHSGFILPGTRDSGYFPTKDSARHYLDIIERLQPYVAKNLLRTHP